MRGCARGWLRGSRLGLLDFFPGGNVVRVAMVDPEEAAIAEGVGAAVDRLGAMPRGFIAALAAFAFHDCGYWILAFV
jgi:hypothetical protein